jgi:hypothetical protein
MNGVPSNKEEGCGKSNQHKLPKQKLVKAVKEGEFRVFSVIPDVKLGPNLGLWITPLAV